MLELQTTILWFCMTTELKMYTSASHDHHIILCYVLQAVVYDSLRRFNKFSVFEFLQLWVGRVHLLQNRIRVISTESRRVY